MRKYLSIAVIAGLILAQVVGAPHQAQAQPPDDSECALSMWVIRDGWVSFPGNILIWATNNTSTPVELRSITYQWTPSTYSVYRVGWNGGDPIQYFEVNDTSGAYTATTSILLQPGERAGITVIHNYPVTAPQWNNAICSSYTPPYGLETPTPTPTPTGTPRPNTEATVAAKMVEASNAVSSSLNIDNLQPYDWQSGGSSITFPNLFDGAIAPYFSLIFSYMLALVEIFNTNNVVVIIFILTLSISILMIVVKMVSGGALSGWKSSGIPDALDNPYKTLNRRK